jgi:glycosyltransferase involved in cell wall biosynthesis
MARSVAQLLSVPALAKAVRLVATTPTAHTGAALKLMAAARAAAELQTQMRTGRRVPVVHLHLDSGPWFYRDALLGARARAAGAKLVVSVHGSDFDQVFGDERGAMARTLLAMAARVLVPAPALLAGLRGSIPRERLQVVPVGVWLPDEPPALPTSSPPRVLIDAGGDPSAEGMFVRAVRALPASLQAHWLLVGEGDLRDFAASLSGCRRGPVDAVGWMAGRKAERVWARSQVAVLPQRSMGLPLRMLEAMARGRSVLASSVCGVPDALWTDSPWLVEPRAEAWTHSLARLLADPSLLETWGSIARLRAEALFDARTVAARLLQVYREVGAGRRSSMLARLPLALESWRPR